jgi:hypothetical protein
MRSHHGLIFWPIGNVVLSVIISNDELKLYKNLASDVAI